MSAGGTVVVDLGGSNLRVALVRGGRVSSVTRRASGELGGFDAVVAAIATEAGRLAGEHGTDGPVVVASAGSFDRATGTILSGANLGWRNVPFRSALSAQLGGRPVLMENDLSCAALGEWRHGAGSGSVLLAMVGIGTGVGLGVVAGGAIRSGSHGLAGEIGHLPIGEPSRRPCGCGRTGCLETEASGRALAARGRELLASGAAPALGDAAGDDPAAVTGAIVLEAAAGGDAACQELVDAAVRRLAMALRVVCFVADPDVVVVGGGVGRNEWFYDRLEHAARGELDGWPVSLRRSTLGDDAALLGGAVLAGTPQRSGGTDDLGLPSTSET